MECRQQAILLRISAKRGTNSGSSKRRDSRRYLDIALCFSCNSSASSARAFCLLPIETAKTNMGT